MDEIELREYNKFAFGRACDAVSAGSYHKARAFLSDINMEKISDADVESHVQYCKDICKFCIDYGVPYEAGADFGRILQTSDYSKVLGKSRANFFGGGWLKTAGAGVDTARLAASLPNWLSLEKKLYATYA